MLVVAFLLIFDSGILAPITKQLADNTYSYLAAAGASMSANVPENEYNAFTAQLTEEQRRLDAREQALNEREIAARSYGEGDATDYSTYILSVLLFIIVVLLVLNYVMDWQRARRYYQYENRTA